MSDRNTLDSLFHLLHALKRQLHEQAGLLKLDITPMHIRVLKIIDRKKDCTAIDVASFLGRDKAQITRLITTLIEKDLLAKAPNPTDKRSHYLRITASGDEIIAKIAGIDADTIKKMTANLTPQEIEDFQRIAQVITENLSAN